MDKNMKRTNMVSLADGRQQLETNTGWFVCYEHCAIDYAPFVATCFGTVIVTVVDGHLVLCVERCD